MADNATSCWSQTMPLTSMLKVNLTLVAAIDIIPALLCILGNLVIIITLVKTRSLHTPSNVLLGALCISDLLVGFLSQPFFLAYLLMILSGYEYADYHIVRYIYNHISGLCGGLSFLSAMFIAVDRYFAICHPFKYQRSVTCKKYVYFVGATAGFLATLTAISLLPALARFHIYELICAVLQLMSFLVVFFCYARIHRVLHQIKTAVVPLGTFSGEREAEVAARRQQDTAKTHTIFIILGFLIFCYSPLLVLSLYVLARPNGICDIFEDIFIAYIWITLLVFASSSINPVVYFLRSKETRKAARKLLRS